MSILVCSFIILTVFLAIVAPVVMPSSNILELTLTAITDKTIIRDAFATMNC